MTTTHILEVDIKDMMREWIQKRYPDAKKAHWTPITSTTEEGWMFPETTLHVDGFTVKVTVPNE